MTVKQNRLHLTVFLKKENIWKWEIYYGAFLPSLIRAMALKCLASQFQISPSLFSFEVLKLYPVDISPFAAVGRVTRRSWRDSVRGRGFLLLCAISMHRPASESAYRSSDSTLFRNLRRLVLAFTILQVFLIWQATLASELW